jgi:hypothetical protein
MQKESELLLPVNVLCLMDRRGNEKLPEKSGNQKD